MGGGALKGERPNFHCRLFFQFVFVTSQLYVFNLGTMSGANNNTQTLPAKENTLFKKLMVSLNFFVSSLFSDPCNLE